jgi:hypothetical protein
MHALMKSSNSRDRAIAPNPNGMEVMRPVNEVQSSIRQATARYRPHSPKKQSGHLRDSRRSSAVACYVAQRSRAKNISMRPGVVVTHNVKSAWRAVAATTSEFILRVPAAILPRTNRRMGTVPSTQWMPSCFLLVTHLAVI